MITLKEIAAELGVSVSTVSRVLTNKDKVDPEKRRMIQEALTRHNYIPNEMARGLRGVASRSIGVIVPTLSSTYYTRIITAAQEIAQKNSYTIVTCCSNYDPEREKEAVQLLKTKHISRVMCASTLGDASSFYKQKFGDHSAVIFDSDTRPAPNLGYISFDSFAAARRLADYQLDLGHRDFLILNHSASMRRQNGFLDALRARDIEISPDRIANGLRQPDVGYNICRQIFADPAKRPTAVLATNDVLAYAAIRAAYDAGLTVPGDLSVACFDACDETGILSPKITCIMQPASRIGALASQMLIDGSCAHVTVDTEFVAGTSCQRR